MVLCVCVVMNARGAEGVDGVEGVVDVESYNFVLGTQAIGGKYGFTDEPRLVEWANEIRAMGSNLLKFSLSTRASKDRPEIDTLVELARDDATYRRVLDMPFAHTLMWARGVNAGRWQDGYAEDEASREYQQVYELTRYLLDRYRGTGRTFMLGHWEGDWYLHPGFDRDATPSPIAIQGMIDWLNTRQRAVDNARRDAGADVNVEVYHYTELNMAQKGMAGGVCLVNNVLPHVDVDFVSYSCYDTIVPKRFDVSVDLPRALDYIESKMKPKPWIEGKRVFIGEYGFPLEQTKTGERQAELSRAVCEAAVGWGCRYVLYWQIYCNEIKNDKHRGFWLIDDKGAKQPFYFWMRDFYGEARRYIRLIEAEKGRAPTAEEFQAFALEVLGRE
jgi:hypothetical protein